MKTSLDQLLARPEDHAVSAPDAGNTKLADPVPAGWSPSTESELRAILFAGRAVPAGLAIANAGAVYGQIVKECRGGAPALVVDRLLRECALNFTRILSGPGGHPRDLPPTDGNRIAWDQAALLYLRLRVQLIRAWHVGGAWREALDARTAESAANVLDGARV